MSRPHFAEHPSWQAYVLLAWLLVFGGLCATDCSAKVMEVTGDTPRYYHADQVGNTVALTDATGAVSGRIDYAPFGEVVARSGNPTTPFLYNGESGVETDANNLLYMRARYYQPRLMRFLNADPIRFEGGMNWYAFAGNNPLGYSDPTGTERMASAGADLDYGMGKLQQLLNDRRVVEDRWESPAFQAIRAVVPFVDAIAEAQLSETDAALRSATIDTTLLALGAVGNLGRAAETGLAVERQAVRAVETRLVSATAGRRSGELVSAAKLDRLDKILAKNNCKLVRGADSYLDKIKADGAFEATRSGASTLCLRSNPTKYERFHELKHFGDFNRLGFDKYRKLYQYGREESVYRYMMRQSWISSGERAHAQWYMDSF